jgi:hypothetical protein
MTQDTEVIIWMIVGSVCAGLTIAMITGDSIPGIFGSASIYALMASITAAIEKHGVKP